MNNHQSIFLLELKPFVTEQSRIILSNLLGIETKVLIFGEEEKVTIEMLNEMYALPIISITVESDQLGGDLILLMDQSSVIHLLNYRIDREFSVVEDKKEFQNKVVQFVQEYIGGIVKAFSERSGRKIIFSPSIHFRYLSDEMITDHVSAYTRIDANVIIEDDVVGRVIVLLSSGIVKTYLENRDQIKQYFKQGDQNRNDQSTKSPLVGSMVRNLQGCANIGMLLNLELPVAIELGQIRMMVKDILELEPGQIVELHKYSSEPVDIYLDHKKFAEGEVIMIDHNFGVKITALVRPDERLSPLL